MITHFLSTIGESLWLRTFPSRLQVRLHRILHSNVQELLGDSLMEAMAAVFAIRKRGVTFFGSKKNVKNDRNCDGLIWFYYGLIWFNMV